MQTSSNNNQPQFDIRQNSLIKNADINAIRVFMNFVIYLDRFGINFPILLENVYQYKFSTIAAAYLEFTAFCKIPTKTGILPRKDYFITHIQIKNTSTTQQFTFLSLPCFFEFIFQNSEHAYLYKEVSNLNPRPKDKSQAIDNFTLNREIVEGLSLLNIEDPASIVDLIKRSGVTMNIDPEYVYVPKKVEEIDDDDTSVDTKPSDNNHNDNVMKIFVQKIIDNLNSGEEFPIIIEDDDFFGSRKKYIRQLLNGNEGKFGFIYGKDFITVKTTSDRRGPKPEINKITVDCFQTLMTKLNKDIHDSFDKIFNVMLKRQHSLTTNKTNNMQTQQPTQQQNNSAIARYSNLNTVALLDVITRLEEDNMRWREDSHKDREIFRELLLQNREIITQNRELISLYVSKAAPQNFTNIEQGKMPKQIHEKIATKQLTGKTVAQKMKYIAVKDFIKEKELTIEKTVSTHFGVKCKQMCNAQGHEIRIIPAYGNSKSTLNTYPYKVVKTVYKEFKKNKTI